MSFGLRSILASILATVLISVTAPFATAASAATYTLDGAHSFVFFKVGHMGFSKVVGRFNAVSGSFTVDDATGALTGARIEVQTASVDTGVARRDNHLKSADFFNAAQFPAIVFQSAGVRGLDNGRYELDGTIDLHGVTRPVTLVVAQIGAGNDAGGAAHIGAEGTLAVKRTDFGMTSLLDAAGDDVELFLNFEGIKN
jgi:polyisoprenoid-binding protein YceI